MSYVSSILSCGTGSDIDMVYSIVPATLMPCQDGLGLDEDETPVYRSAAPLHTRYVLCVPSDSQVDDHTATIPVRAMNERLLELFNRWRLRSAGG